MRDAGVRRLVRPDALRRRGVSDAYDTEGYSSYFTVRGFVIDNRFNYRRDGLPINAETSIPLDNKARVDILKGMSGMQAGTSAPGGLVDLVVKRPLDAPLRSAFVEWRERGSVLGAVDLSQRFGDRRRLRPAPQRRRRAHRPAACATPSGNRNLLALAGDWRVAQRHAARGRGREPAAARSRACPASACSATCVPAPCRPAHQPQQPAVVASRWCSTRRPRSLRCTQQLDARLALRRARRDAAAAAPTTASPSRSAASSEPRRRHLLRRPLLPERQLRPLRLPQRERAAPQRRARPRAARPRSRPARCAHALARRRAAEPACATASSAQAFNFVGTGNVDGTLTRRRTRR